MYVNQHLLYIYIPFITTFVSYWLTVFGWFLCDLYVDPKYRIERTIDWKLYKKSAIHTVIMQLSITPIVLYYTVPIWSWLNNDVSYRGLYTLKTLQKFLICPFITEIVFFYTHKLAHTRYLYMKVHRVHHEWNVPCAVATGYSHPIEYIFCSLPSFILPPLLLNLNWYATQIWYVLASISVISTHSGYIFTNGSVRHTDHHIHNTRNYGPLTILDMLHGTEVPTRKI